MGIFHLYKINYALFFLHLIKYWDMHGDAEREGFEPPVPIGYTAFRVQRIQPDSAISPNIVLN